MKSRSYQKRHYRDWVANTGLISFEVIEEETDLYISADKDLRDESLKLIRKYRKQLQDYIRIHPEFEKTLEPVETEHNTPAIIKEMAQAAFKAGVGPFAAVAGAIAEYTGKDLLKLSSQVIVENGGDIFMAGNTDRILGIYAGDSPFTGKLGLKITKELMPVGICTSSGTVGHSLSFGKADAVVIISRSTLLADAVATATANQVKTAKDINKAIEFTRNIEGIIGAIVIIGNDIGAWGDLELVET